MRTILLALLLSGFVTLAGAADPAWVVPLPPDCAELLNVLPLHDADTPKGDLVTRGPRFGALQVDLVFRSVSIRLTGFDAYEVSRTRDTQPFRSFTPAQWEQEIARGLKARDELRKLSEGKSWLIRLDPQDSVYGRKQGAGYLKLDDKRAIDVAAWARANGHDRTPPSPTR